MPHRDYECPTCGAEVTILALMSDPAPTCTGTDEQHHEPTTMESRFHHPPEVNVKGGTPTFHG